MNWICMFALMGRHCCMYCGEVTVTMTTSMVIIHIQNCTIRLRTIDETFEGNFWARIELNSRTYTIFQWKHSLPEKPSNIRRKIHEIFLLFKYIHFLCFVCLVERFMHGICFPVCFDCSGFENFDMFRQFYW